MNDYNRKIKAYLDSMKIDQSLNGYRYLIDAIRICLEDKKKLKKITDIYSIIADENSSNINCIERGIGYSLSGLEISNKSFVSKAVYDIEAD